MKSLATSCWWLLTWGVVLLLYGVAGALFVYSIVVDFRVFLLFGAVMLAIIGLSELFESRS